MKSIRQALRVGKRKLDIYGCKRLDAEHTVRVAKCVFEGWGLLYGDRPLYAGASTSFKFVPLSTCPIVLFANA